MSRFPRIRESLWLGSIIAVVLLTSEAGVLGQMVWNEQLDRFVGENIDDARYLPSRALLMAFSNEPNLKRAKELATRAVELTERAAVEPLVALAIVRWEQGRPKEARTILEEALAVPMSFLESRKLAFGTGRWRDEPIRLVVASVSGREPGTHARLVIDRVQDGDVEMVRPA